MRLLYVKCRACGRAVYQHPRPPERQWWDGRMVMCEHGIGPRKKTQVLSRPAAGPVEPDGRAPETCEIEHLDLDAVHWCGLFTGC